MAAQRQGSFGRWLWAQLHRDHESYWWLPPVLLAWLGLVLAAVGVAAHLIDSSWRPLIVLAAFAHQLMWGVLVAVVLFAIARRWWALFLALVLFTGVVATQAGLYFSSESPYDGPVLTVLQANLRLGRADAATFVTLVRQRHVDIATTDELTMDEQRRLIAAGLSAELPYHFTEPAIAGAGVGIWSRYPLSDTVNHPGFKLGVLSASVELPGHTFTVVAVHLPSPYPHPVVRWARELVKLKTVLDAAETGGRPVVVGGDFNATVDHGQFRELLSGGYGDTAEEVGAGYLPTYPANRWFPPLIAIDHVLTANVVPEDLSSVELPGSDHRGLVARIAI